MMDLDHEPNVLNKRLSEKRSAIVTPTEPPTRVVCSMCFVKNDIFYCIHCKKPCCNECLTDKQCEYCYDKHNNCLTCLYKYFCKFHRL